MKLFKRILAVTVLIAVILLISYCIYTGEQINA